jgi:hypothetical protein
MEDRFDMAKLLDLRKLTTVIAEFLEARLNGYLTTLQPLFQPQTVLGNNVRPGSTATLKGADKAFADLQASYLALAGGKTFNLPKALEAPISVTTAKPEIVRVEYLHEAEDGGTSQKLTTISPLKWVLTYSGFTPARLRGLLAQGDNVSERDLKDTLLHMLMMNLVVTHQTGLGEILSALGFTVASGRAAEFGELPLTTISAPVATKRPPDQVMLQIAAVSGSPMFEEVVRVEDIVGMKNPLKEQLLEQAKSHAGHLLEAAGAG